MVAFWLSNPKVMVRMYFVILCLLCHPHLLAQEVIYTDDYEEEEVGLTPEFVPVYQLGNQQGELIKLYWTLSDYIEYPVEYCDSAHKRKRVVVQFDVESNGKISDVKVLRRLNPVMDREAVRVIKLLKCIRPAYTRGKPVKHRETIPVVFCKNQQSVNNVDLKIDAHWLSGDTLTLKYSFKNNTDETHSVYWGGGWSTLPEVSNLALLVFENDTLALHIGNPFDGYPSLKYQAIEPHGTIHHTIQIDLKHLYTTNCILFLCPPHLITGRCSFRLIYYDRNSKADKYKVYLNNKRVKQHIPVSDTLRSNVVYIDK
jgi:TonB family protein